LSSTLFPQLKLSKHYAQTRVNSWHAFKQKQKDAECINQY